MPRRSLDRPVDDAGVRVRGCEHGTVEFADLGTRVVVIGPSNSGKSTLAVAIGRARRLPVVHLDILRHAPGAHWRMRSDADFSRAHDAAIRDDRWVIDGNYSGLLADRLSRATGLVVLDVSTGRSIVRYVRRTLDGRHGRLGGLDGVRDRLSWGMIRHIAGPTRENRRRYRAVFAEATLPKVLLANPRQLDAFARREGLALDR